MSAPAIDSGHFRRTLGLFPTGVVVVTASGEGDAIAGMTIGSFTSVSLDPPLVAFLPARDSRSWKEIEAAGSFCVNVLAAEQEHVCRAFAQRHSDVSAGVRWDRTSRGCPRLHGAVAWIECETENVIEAGDHVIVIGRVHALDVGTPGRPLIFYSGGYGGFAAGALASAEPGLAPLMPVVDQARIEMAALSADLDVPSVAVLRMADTLVIAAVAHPPRSAATTTWIGTRLPFTAPFSNVFTATDADSAVATCPASQRDLVARSLALVRERGYSVGVRGDSVGRMVATIDRMAREGRRQETVDEARELSAALLTEYDPERLDDVIVDGLLAPVHSADGSVQLAIGLEPLPDDLSPDEVKLFGERLLVATARLSAP